MQKFEVEIFYFFEVELKKHVEFSDCGISGIFAKLGILDHQDLQEGLKMIPGILTLNPFSVKLKKTPYKLPFAQCFRIYLFSKFTILYFFGAGCCAGK
jgi:hypothetical protein